MTDCVIDLTVRRQRVGEVVMRVGKIGVDPHSVTVVFDRVSRLALRSQNDRRLNVRLGVVRVDPQHVLQMRHRLVRLVPKV